MTRETYAAVLLDAFPGEKFSAFRKYQLDLYALLGTTISIADEAKQKGNQAFNRAILAVTRDEIAPTITKVVDVNYVVSPEDTTIAYTSLTAGRTVTFQTPFPSHPITITDMAGTAAANNITISSPSGKFNGATADLVFATAYGSVTLYIDPDTGDAWVL